MALANAGLITWSVAASSDTSDDAAEPVTQAQLSAGVATATVAATTTVAAGTTVTAGTSVSAGTTVVAGTSISSGTTIVAGSTVKGTTGVLVANNKISAGAGTPEGAVIGIVGDLFLRTDGGAGTTLYVKETGTGNTGWVAK